MLFLLPPFSSGSGSPIWVNVSPDYVFRAQVFQEPAMLHYPAAAYCTLSGFVHRHVSLFTQMSSHTMSVRAKVT